MRISSDGQDIISVTKSFMMFFTLGFRGNHIRRSTWLKSLRGTSPISVLMFRYWFCGSSEVGPSEQPINGGIANMVAWWGFESSWSGGTNDLLCSSWALPRMMEEWLQWDVIGSSDQWIDINGVSTSKNSVEYGGMMRIMIKLFMVRVVYVIPNVVSPPARWTKVQIRSSSPFPRPFLSVMILYRERSCGEHPELPERRPERMLELLEWMPEKMPDRMSE